MLNSFLVLAVFLAQPKLCKASVGRRWQQSDEVSRLVGGLEMRTNIVHSLSDGADGRAAC